MAVILLRRPEMMLFSFLSNKNPKKERKETKKIEETRKTKNMLSLF